MLVRDGREQSPPSQAQPVGRARPGPHSPQPQLGVYLLGCRRRDLQDAGREHAAPGQGTDCSPLPACALKLCRQCRQMRRRGLLRRLGVGGGGSEALRGGKKGRHRSPCLGGDTQSSPAPSRVFILYLLGTEAKEPCLGGAHFQPSLPGHSTSSSLFLGHCDLGAGRIAEGQVQAGLRGGGNGGGLGPSGAPPGLPSAHHFRGWV